MTIKTNQKQRTIGSLYSLMKPRIDLSDSRFQRGSVWTKDKEQFLIDTIIKGLDIPKLYLWEKDNNEYAVVDGQQRLKTIFKFLSNNLELSSEYTPEFANKRFDELTDDIKDFIYNSELTIVFIEKANLDDIQDLFLRLNNGYPLKSQEKRVNIGGNLANFIVELTSHNIFNKVPFKNKHRDFEQVLAQCIKLEFECSPTNTQGKYLDQMYKDEKQFDINGTVAKRFKKVLNYLNNIFLNDTRVPELDKYYFISLYLLISQMLDKFVITDQMNLFRDFFIEFTNSLINYRSQDEIKDENRNLDYDTFIQYISSRTDSLEAIDGRHKILFKYFLLKYPELELLDNNRNFSEEQRIVIYRRDKEICWHCNKHVDWLDFEADHRPKPYSKGGKTIVANGVCAHKLCNVKASNKDNLIRGWLA